MLSECWLWSTSAAGIEQDTAMDVLHHLHLHIGDGRVERGPEHQEKINSSLSAFASLALYLQMMQKLKYSIIQSNPRPQDELLHSGKTEMLCSQQDNVLSLALNTICWICFQVIKIFSFRPWLRTAFCQLFTAENKVGFS